MPPSSRGTDALIGRRTGGAARFAPAALCLAFAALALAVSRHYAVDWFYNDDLATLRWFAEADAGRLGPAAVLDLWNNEHPVGAQFALLWLARLAVGLDMRAFVALSACTAAVTAAVAARLAADARDPLAVRCAAVAACFALAFHPTQAEHLLWSFELGWFVVDAVVVAGAALAERFGPRAAVPTAALCALASLASAQGALAFLAAAAHQALMPARRGRGAAALFLAFGGALAVAHLQWRPHASPSGPARPDGDVAGTAVYALELLGGLFGLRSHAVLAAGGAALAAAAALLLWRRRRSSRPDRVRAALALFLFSGLCVAAFAHGRHHLGIDWATASFHAAPLLVPFALGLVVLLGAPPGPAAFPRRDAALAGVAAALLAASTVAAVPYGLTWARLWAMDRGYARWAACSGAVPASVAARGSGVAYDLPGFGAVRPLAERMCAAPAGPLEGALLRRPPSFDALAAGRPALDPALDALWQDYATDLTLQLAFKPWRADTPGRLLAFARADAEKGGEIDPGGLGPYADLFRALPR